MKLTACVVLLVVLAVASAVEETHVRKLGRRGNGDGTCPGKCQDINKLSCATGYVRGLCPGKSNIRCCPPAETPLDPTPSGNKKLSQVSFKQLVDSYPNAADANVAKAHIGGAVNAAWITNTCTIRVSRALNYAGVKIPKNLKLPALGAGALLNTVSGADGLNYAFRVREFTQYMHLVHGPPTLTTTNGRCDKGKEKSQGLDIPPEWHNKNGLVMFDVRCWSDASGHFDIWHGTGVPNHANDPGSKCVHECYWPRACAAALWEIPRA